MEMGYFCGNRSKRRFINAVFRFHARYARCLTGEKSDEKHLNIPYNDSEERESMNRFEEGMKFIDNICGNGKDNVICLATIAIEPGKDGNVRPFTRDVDAFYEDGVLYISTHAKSIKMQQIERNPNVSFSVNFEGIAGNGVGENLGWVLAPQNAKLRDRLREVFSGWYDVANNEQDENSIILAIRIASMSVMRDHGAVRYDLDLMNEMEGEEVKIR